MREKDDAKRARLVSNERATLSATFLNTIAVAVIGSGLIAPFFVLLYGLGNVSADQIRFFALAAPGWVLLGTGLHFVARAILGCHQRMTWFEWYALLSPLTIFVLGAWLVYDANRWRWR